ncbi:hypothetical protein [Holophaga foetida]|uniref:hypothetical protein n=1 Tax=Holophaga foetida TaxID=35839 RepID=UPI000247508E|nr:hypothetical protein [Holophaga foetida]
MGKQSPEDPKAGWLHRLEQSRSERTREAEEFPRLSREDLEHPERYHQRLQDWIRKQGHIGRH